MTTQENLLQAIKKINAAKEERNRMPKGTQLREVVEHKILWMENQYNDMCEAAGQEVIF